MMSAKYSEYYTIILRGPFFRGHTVYTICLCTHLDVSRKPFVMQWVGRKARRWTEGRFWGQEMSRVEAWEESGRWKKHTSTKGC